jgi:two-component system, chemotaxis family, protein-glutamate methylesterase/glutaminase
MPGHDIILIGASAGGVQGLSTVIGALPRDLPAAVFVVLHIAPYGRSAMPSILARAGVLPATHAEDGEPVEPGRVYVAPADHHILVEPGCVRLSRAPTENGQRPSVDVLFRSAAQAYGPRCIGVVLTGNLDDGTVGLAVVKKYGGLAIVQDPEEADYPSMPRSAIQNVEVDHVRPLAGIPPLLVELAHEPVIVTSPLPEAEHMKTELEHGNDPEDRGVPSDLTCPECGGSLRESRVDGVIHFRCRTGHAYSPETLLVKQGDVVDAAIWAAVRALQENAELARRMDRRLQQTGMAAKMAHERYERRAQEAEHHAEILRRLLMQDKARVG